MASDACPASPRSRSTTIAMLRAYLRVAAIGAICIEAISLVASLLFDVSDAFFETDTYRAGALLMLVAFVATTRLVALRAYRDSLTDRTAVVVDSHRQAVHLSSRCPVHGLVLLHLRFSRRPFYLVEARDAR
jgi:hypothetical protein